MLLHRLINSVPGFAENLSTDVHYTDPNYLNYNEPIHDTSSTDYINTRSSSSTSTRSDIDMLYPHARPVWKDMQVLPRTHLQEVTSTCSIHTPGRCGKICKFFLDFSHSTASTQSSTRGTPSSDQSSSTLLLLQHCRHIFTKVYINVVFIESSSTHNRHHTTSST
jgi:hypothetical protein